MKTSSRILPRLLGLLVAAGALSLGQTWAQEAPQGNQTLEVRVEARTEGGAQQRPRGQELRVVIDSQGSQVLWRARLTDLDIDARELAFEELVARARWDQPLRLALQSWSLDPGSPELAWTARMALRELRQSTNGLRLGWVDRKGKARAQDDESKAAMLRAIDVEPILPLPERVQPLSPLKSLSMYQPRAFQLPQRLERHVYKLDVQPEGVVLTEFIQDGNQVRQRRYAAESSGALLEAYPALRSRVPGLAGILAKPFGPGSQFRWDRNQELLRFGSSDPGYAAEVSFDPRFPSGPVVALLGVKVTPVTDDATAATLLGPGVGLLIERREPGSMAEDLGLQRGDILIEMAGQPLCSPQEISRLLQQSGQQQEIVFKFLDRFRLERTVTWSPKAPQ